MKATLLADERFPVGEGGFVDILMWQVPVPVRGSTHDLKYSLAYVVNDTCVLRYDNEAGKGDHRHLGAVEERYDFTTVDRLLADFRKDVSEWNEDRRS